MNDDNGLHEQITIGIEFVSISIVSFIWITCDLHLISNQTNVETCCLGIEFYYITENIIISIK